MIMILYDDDDDDNDDDSIINKLSINILRTQTFTCNMKNK